MFFFLNWYHLCFFVLEEGWHDQQEIEFLKRWVYKFKFEQNLRKIDEEDLMNDCQAFGSILKEESILEENFSDTEECIQFLLENYTGLYVTHFLFFKS